MRKQCGYSGIQSRSRCRYWGTRSRSRYIPWHRSYSRSPYSGRVFHAGTSAPSNKGLLWIDTTASTGGLKYHNGSAWVHVPVSSTVFGGQGDIRTEGLAVDLPRRGHGVYILRRDAAEKAPEQDLRAGLSLLRNASGIYIGTGSADSGNAPVSATEDRLGCVKVGKGLSTGPPCARSPPSGRHGTPIPPGRRR